MTAAPQATATLSAADRDAVLRRLERFAWLMDSSIRLPFMNASFGIDAAIGILPIGGDLAGALISCYVPFEAYRIGAPLSLIFKMFVNLLIDAVVGSVPALGDIFDAAWKVNERNLALLKDYLDRA